MFNSEEYMDEFGFDGGFNNLDCFGYSIYQVGCNNSELFGMDIKPCSSQHFATIICQYEDGSYEWQCDNIAYTVRAETEEADLLCYIETNRRLSVLLTGISSCLSDASDTKAKCIQKANEVKSHSMNGCAEGGGASIQGSAGINVPKLIIAVCIGVGTASKHKEDINNCNEDWLQSSLSCLR